MLLVALLTIEHSKLDEYRRYEDRFVSELASTRSSSSRIDARALRLGRPR